MRLITTLTPTGLAFIPCGERGAWGFTGSVVEMELHGAHKVARAATAQVQEPLRVRKQARRRMQEHSGLAGQQQEAGGAAAGTLCLLHNPVSRLERLHLHTPGTIASRNFIIV